MKKIKIVIIMVLCFCFFSSISAEPIINVDIEPKEPVAGSQITITADISSENNIDKVYLEIQECKEDLCFTKENKTMNLVNSVYKTTYKLTKTEATYFKYSFSIKFDDGQWYETGKTDVTLKSSSNNGTNGGDGENKKTPGFELILLIIVLTIFTILLKRKRF